MAALSPRQLASAIAAVAAAECAIPASPKSYSAAKLSPTTQARTFNRSLATTPRWQHPRSCLEPRQFQKTRLCLEGNTGLAGSIYSSFKHTPNPLGPAARLWTQPTLLQQGAASSSTPPRASVSAPADAPSNAVITSPLPWKWQPKNFSSPPISINTVSFSLPSSPSSTSGPTILLLPALSDVETVDEWRAVAPSLLSFSKGRFRVLSLDWPGFGASGSPPLLYTVDMLQDFLTDYISHLFPEQKPESPAPLVLVGAGHAATIALRGVARGSISPAALAAVAPTWGGPLPIVFGNDDKMTGRYSLLRNLIRSPGVGWALYGYLTSEKQMKMQYMTHVYADADNVTAELVDSRTKLTKRDGARFAPSSFLTGLLDPAKSREEFLSLFASAGERGVPVAVLASSGSPKRSRREMESLQGAPGVAVYETVRGALLAHEEYPQEVADALEAFLGSSEVKTRLPRA